MTDQLPVPADQPDLMVPAVEAVEGGPPSQHLPPGEWLRQNLFNGIVNTVITLVVGIGGLTLAILALVWAFGADYAIVRANLRLFMIGQFPSDELWRPWVSGFILIGAFGFLAGALGRNAYESNLAKGLPAAKSTWFELVRRFWAIPAVLIFFVSFARTLQPYVGLVAVLVLLVAGRELGWRASAAVRDRAVYIGAVLFIVSMLVIAGTSQLGGLTLGLVGAVWAFSEFSRLDLGEGEHATPMQRWAPLGAAVVVGAVLFVIEILIPHDGIGWEKWGGLHVTLFTTVLGIALGLPFGILLALGRRSNLPVLKTSAVVFIEFIRGVPLISLLLFSNLMLPLFIPGDRPADLSLAIIVITGFSAAYIAEIVRGGLQAVPKGQTEAAQASGMSASSVQRLIVLPQALRAVIPAMVGQFIALFKDTSLLSIIGILEFLKVSEVANTQADFLGKGLAPVTYLFVAIGYWAFAYTMSKESRRLETRLGVGVR
jgi:general L-amino acid transport system permease protein